MLLRILTLLCLLYLSACSATNQTHIFTPIQSNHNKTIVYLYRPFSLSNAVYSPDIYVNGELKSSLKNGKKFLLTLLPGDNTFEIEPGKKYSETTTITFNLKAGNIYYLRLDTSLNIKKTLSYKPYQRSFNLIKIDNQTAEKEIAECCSNIKIVDKINPVRKSEHINGGFSVDKTQNPFSH